jgi:triacylglycerol lipase
MDVVMVHGFFDTGRLFRAMVGRLEDRGHTCHAPTLEPLDGRLGIADLSEKLAGYIRKNVEADAPAALVGFSMGALVARHYLQNPGRTRPMRAFFSIAGPHGGTPTAYFFPGAGTRQMRPGSPFIKELNERSDALRSLRVYTFRTPFDLMVVPPASTRIPLAREIVVRSLFHSRLPSDPDVIGHILSELGAMESNPQVTA